MVNDSTPDFVIIGMPHGDEVLVYASTSLTQAELSYEAEYAEYRYEPMRRYPISQSYTLTAEMRDFVVVRSSDYATAMRVLFEQWTPKRRPQQQRRLGPQSDRSLSAAANRAIEG